MKELSESEEELLEKPTEESTKEQTEEPTKKSAEVPKKEMKEGPKKIQAKELTEEPKKTPVGEPTKELKEEPTNEIGNQDIAIDESNFPDSYFREYISLVADIDKNGVLSLDERNAIREIADSYYDPEESVLYNDSYRDITFEGERWYDLLAYTKSFEGIQYFQNLYKIVICRINLEELHLDNPNLEVLVLERDNLSALTLGSCPKLRILLISSSKLEEIDISGSEQLERFNVSSIKYNKSDLLKNKNLEDLFLYVQDIDSLNDDLNSLVNLKSLGIAGDYSVDEIDLTKLKKLEELHASINMQKLNLQGLENLKEITVYKAKEINVTGCYKLRCVWINRNKDITKLDLSTNINLYSIGCQDSSLKEIILPHDKVYIHGDEDLIIYYAID